MKGSKMSREKRRKNNAANLEARRVAELHRDKAVAKVQGLEEERDKAIRERDGAYSDLAAMKEKVDQGLRGVGRVVNGESP